MKIINYHRTVLLLWYAGMVLTILCILIPTAHAENQEVKTLKKRLSSGNIKTWNRLFGKYLKVSQIYSVEVVDLSGNNDIGVLFTVLVNQVDIPSDTVILPELETRGRLKDKYFTVENRVVYGLFLKTKRNKSWQLKLYGESDFIECERKNQSGKRGHLFSIDGGFGECEALHFKETKFLNIRRLLSGAPPQILFSGGGSVLAEASGYYDHLFLFDGTDIKPIFFTWHDRYGDPDHRDKVELYKDKIIEYSSLHTPFQIPTHYYWSFTSKSIYSWNGSKFVIVEESIDPLRLDLDGQGFADYKSQYSENEKEIEILITQQELYNSGKETYLGDPIEIARRECEKCKDFKVAFKKDGVAVVWATQNKEQNVEHVSFYLYKPFISHKGTGAKSIWAIAYDERDNFRKSYGK